MSKNKATILLSILSVVVAAILVLTFIQFPVSVKDSYVGAVGGINLDYDLSGGVAYTLTLSSDNEEEVENIDELVNVLKHRIDVLGYSTYSIKVLENSDPAVLDKDIRIELKANHDSVNEDIEAIIAYGDIKFFGGTETDPINQVMKDIKVIEQVSYMEYTEAYKHRIVIKFTQEGKEALFKLMDDAGSDSAYNLKIACGDVAHEKTIFSAQISKEYFDGNSISITSISTKEQAMRMILQITEGGIAYDYHYESTTITSPYGADVATKLMFAVIALVAVLMVVYVVIYRGLGVVTALSTLLFILAETWLMIGVPGIVLSMGGVIGIISATIICAMSMFAFAQRVKDEYASSKKTTKAAIAKGFRQSLVPTINMHVVVGVVSLALFFLANSLLKNFAITLGIGMAVSLLSTLVFTRMYTALLLPLVKNKEKFLRFKRADVADEEVTEA